MDIFVPSPSMMSSQFATSPQSLSIYDQERSDIQSSFCGGNNPISKFSTEATCAEDLPVLDDKIEDSNLKNFLTPEFINSFSIPSSSGSSSVLWGNKTTCDNSESSANLTLNEINMDNEMSLFDIFSYDTDDSKLSFPNLDIFNNDIKSNASSSCHTPVPMMCVEPTSVNTSIQSFHNQDNKINVTNELMTSNTVEEPKNIVNDLGRDYYRKMAPPFKANFPRRESQPPIIGVVPPVKKPDSLDTIDTQELKPDIEDLKSHLNYNNFKTSDNKYSKCFNNVATVAYSFQDVPPQTVPSCGSLKRGYEKVKTEPDSPLNKKACMDSASSDMWEDFFQSKNEDTGRPQRKRCDSGGSGHISDIGEDDMKDMDDSDEDDDFSDIDADITTSSSLGSESLIDTGKKQKQFFWQYNVQAKGPKGTRLKLAVDTPKDPHILNDFEDPVFDECNTVVAGIRHGGKARKGDGNEIAPNPRKLVLIGHQLLRLNKKINACQLGSDVPASQRNESRKEKNKLASRACRLKKKAQHEANKIKLHGLEEEHTQLNDLIQQIWPVLRDRAKVLLKQGQLNGELDDILSPSLTSILNSHISSNLKTTVATRTTDFVNNVILKVEAGDLKGGLNIHRKKS